MTEQEFLDFWTNFKWPEVKPVYHRLYHDAAGNPLLYTGDDLPGQYIDITPEQRIIADMSVRVIDGKIVRRVQTAITKLVPSALGTLCHQTDVSVVVTQQPGKYWKKKQNVIETN